MSTATETRKRRAKIAREHGIRNALIALEEADKTDRIGPATAIAILWQESGGKNVWGHDPTIFIGGFDRKNNRYWTIPRWKGYVNEAGYREYKRQRRADGSGGRQGVGPLQLTWHTTQDAADRKGGCWKPRINIRTGFEILDAQVKAHGLRDGLRRYNGSGPNAERYAQEVLAKREEVRDWFGID